MSEELTFERAGEDLTRILTERATLRRENAELREQLAAALKERDEVLSESADRLAYGNEMESSWDSNEDKLHKLLPDLTTLRARAETAERDTKRWNWFFSKVSDDFRLDLVSKEIGDCLGEWDADRWRDEVDATIAAQEAK